MRRSSAALGMLLAVACIGVLAFGRPAHAQSDPADENSVLLRSAYFGVEVQRAGTTQWFPIRVGAEFPVGAGDRIRTGDFGRVDLLWTGTGDLSILLPNAELRLDDIRRSAAGLTAAVTLDTGALITGAAGADVVAFTVTTPTATLSGALTAFAVQASASQSIIILQAGTGQIAAAADSRPIRAGEGALVIGSTVLIEPAPPLPNFVQFEAEGVGCPGIVQSRGGLSLNVRVGPLFDYDELGSIPNGDAVRVVGRSPDNARFRIAYRSSYGWVITEGVQVDAACDELTLPVFPFTHYETIVAAVNPLPDELPVLQVFYGPPEDDLWFYR